MHMANMTTETMKLQLISILIAFCSITQAFSTSHTKPNSTNSNPDHRNEKDIFSGTHEINLINNPGFENKTSKWSLGKYNGGSGLFTADSINPLNGNHSALVVTANNGKQYNDVQLFTFFNLQKQSEYHIAFTASVQSTCEVSISVSNGFENFFETKLILRPDKKLYGPFSFTSKEDNLFSYFSFNLGKTNAAIHLDDVVVLAKPVIREFEQLITTSGINILFNKNKNMLCVSSPSVAKIDIPILLFDANYNVIITDKITEGQNEANITLNNDLTKGKYMIKVFTSKEHETFSFLIP